MTATELTPVEVPDIGDFEDVPIIEILVSPGDTVAAEDPLLTLESDKATMDVPAPFAGTVRELHVSVGDRVSRGSLLLSLEAEGATPAEVSTDAAIGRAEETEEASAPEADDAADDAAADEGTDKAGAGADRTRPSGIPSTPAGPNGSDPTGSSRAPAGPAAGEAGDGEAPVYASPAVRRLARERGVELRGISGSGRKGRITKEDVERALAGAADGGEAGGAGASGAGAGAEGGGLSLLPWPSIDFSRFGEIERVKRSRIQRISAPNLARNWAMIPHVTQHDEADITELESWRRSLNEELSREDVKVTMVAFLVRACVAALREFPHFNSSLDGEELVLKRYINIGFAADTPGGLVVPVIKGADGKGLLEIARELAELSGRARDGKLSPGDMQGASFTISSLGGIGGTAFTPIINAPEVAILGASRSAIKPVWDGKEFQPRLMLPLSLSYDHRVIDGASAARFTVFLGRVLGDLRRALL